MGILEEDRLRMHVLPNDIDINMHMNNARYLNLMDLRAPICWPAPACSTTFCVPGGNPSSARRGSPIAVRCPSFAPSSSLHAWSAGTIDGSTLNRLLPAVTASLLGWVKGALRDGKSSVAPRK